ncbi:glucosaminidase domain-containing protein, partial [Burkholderia gladioli]|uniref:glucosaminidase domain-containing protein n=1 Tax=Burkholderia gladioli TaxID=28095 RepID=UPI003F7918E8
KPDASKPAAGQRATAPASAAPSTASQASTASAPAAAPASSQPRPGETLTFFSLYMHLMDWNTYQSASAQAKVAQVDAAKLNMAPMPYWEGERFYRVGDKANDSQDVPRPKAPAAPPRDLIGEFIQSDFKTIPEPDAPDDDTANLPPPIKGIRIRESPNGKIIGILPKGSELTVSDTDEVAKAKPGWAKIKTIKSGTPAAAVVGGTPSPHAPYGYVYVKELDAVVNPQPLDSVVVLKQPYPVKAGDVVSQLGHYLRYTEAKLLPAKPTRPLLHLEVFAGPDLEAFIQKSRTRAKELPAAKTFLEISPGARLVTELAEPDQKLQPGVKLVPLDANAKGKWVKVQPKTAAPVHGGRHAKPTYTNSGAPVWVDGSLANTTTSAIVPGWKDFPLSFSNAKGPGADFRDVFRRVDLDKAGADSTVKDDKGRAWFLVTIGAKDGSTRQGWVCEQDHPLVRMCGPWDWPGFELIDNSSIMPVDMLKRYIHVTEQYLADESKTEFEASAATVNAGPLITNLEKAIDTDHDGKVTALELKHAQETPWMAEALSHLVVRCESEWGGGLGKWEALSPLMKKLLWLWKTEIERIGKLQWWEQVASVEGFPKEPNPWHFHPIGLVGNFKSIRPAIVGTKSFPAEVIEAAQAAQAKWRIPASISLAQWALESGFGHHLPAGSNNPFGIKANKQDLASENYVNAMTSEFVNGKEIRIPQPFRKFPSLNEAFDFHGQLLATGRAYAEARSKIPDAHEFAKALDHHYATDPNYSKKLIGNYIDPYNLTQYDLEE